MALRNVLVDAEPRDVWGVLSDGKSYAEWVVGTTDIRDVDPQWPAVGSRLAYEARMGPWRVKDESIVRVCEPPQRLELEARFRIAAARVSIEVRPWGDQALVIVDEHSLWGSSFLFENPVVELVLSLRNRRMLRRLAALAERRAPRACQS